MARETTLPASIRLGRVAGIPIGLHYSWFILAALIAFSLAGRFRLTQPDWDASLVWGVAAITAILFFVSLLAHELAHAVVARARGVPVRSITLFALGGVAHIVKDANSATTEFLIAVVGPIVSFAIGFGCLAAARALGWSIDGGPAPGPAGAALGWLGWINVVLATFNLLPGYPLDGGRVLRAVLWGIYKDAERATRHAAIAGQVVATLLIAAGLFQFVIGAGFGALWLALIGWFLLMASQATYAQASVARTLRGVRVADIMASDCATVDGSVTVRSLVDDLLLRTGRRCVMVSHDGHVLGLITPNEVRTVDRSRWVSLTATDIMRPLNRLRTIAPDATANDAFTAMASDDVNQLPVVRDGHLEGIVSRAQILRLLQSRAELGA